MVVEVVVRDLVEEINKLSINYQYRLPRHCVPRNDDE